MVPQHSLLPKSTRDTSAIIRLYTVPSEELAPLILPLIAQWYSIDYRLPVRLSIEELLRDRALASQPTPSDPIVRSLRLELSLPSQNARDAAIKAFILDCLVSSLPDASMELYRDVLVQIVENALDVERTVISSAQDLLFYLDAPAPWAPRNKCDGMALHSIAMHVRSADEMRPFVSDLLEWLQDPNWPVAAGCCEQLKRFPEVVINPIRDLLRTSNDDFWMMQLLIFLERYVEGEIREQAREEVEEMVRNPTEESMESGTLEAAQECLSAMNEWRDAAIDLVIRRASSLSLSIKSPEQTIHTKVDFAVGNHWLKLGGVLDLPSTTTLTMAILPQELIDLIITQIDLHDRRALQTLSSCCTVARCFLSTSRARLWSRLAISHSDTELHDMLVSSGTLAHLVRTIAIQCFEDICMETLRLFDNVTHVEFLGRLEFLPDGVFDYMAELWRVSVITFRETAFDDIAMDLIPLLHEFSHLKEIRFLNCECRGYHPTLEDIADRAYTDVVVSAPESLYLDLTSFGIGITEIILVKSCIFSLERVERLTFAFHSRGSIPERSEATMHKILDALPQPLKELSFRHHDSLSLGDDSRLIPIARIPRISFDIHQDNRPLETIKWWVRNLQDAWSKQRDSWAIGEIYINVIIDCSQGRYVDRGVFDDLLVPDVWVLLDEVLAVVQLQKLVLRVQAVDGIDDEEVLEFEPLLKALFPLSRKRKEFSWGETWRLLYY